MKKRINFINLQNKKLIGVKETATILVLTYQSRSKLSIRETEAYDTWQNADDSNLRPYISPF
jgi:hypothetical protein